MKSIIRALKNAPKRSAILATLAVAVAVPAITFASWGPASRVTFTQDKPASYVTFNSITNNAKYGDERNFVQIAGPDTNNKYVESTTLRDGGKYKVFAFYHNNAAANLNLTAVNTRMIADLPSTVKQGKEEAIEVVIKADNAKHLAADGRNLGNEVWDDALIKATDGDYNIKITASSAKVTSNGAVNGKVLADSLYTENGALLGYNALDGKLPGCYEFAGYVEFEFTATKVKTEEPTKEIQVCDLTTNTVITIDEKNYDSKKHSKNLADCEKIKACRIEDKTIVTIKKSEMSNKYTTDMSKCAATPVTPVTPTTPAPTTPAELPQTGVSGIAAVLSLGSLTAAATYYLASRRNS